MNGKLSQSSSKTASLLCRSADKASRVPEKNRRSCASFTVRENTAALNSQNPVSKLATLRKNERIPLSQAVMTPAEVLLSRLRCFPCSHCHCCGWMWREKVHRTESSTSTERMVHSVRKSLQSILLYYKTGRKRNVWTTLPAKIWVFLTYFLRMCVCVTAVSSVHTRSGIIWFSNQMPQTKQSHPIFPSSGLWTVYPSPLCLNYFIVILSCQHMPTHLLSLDWFFFLLCWLSTSLDTHSDRVKGIIPTVHKLIYLFFKCLLRVIFSVA